MSEVNSDDEDINPCPDCNERGDSCENCLDGMDEVYWRNYEDGRISEQSSYENEQEYEDEQEDDGDRDESFPLPKYSQTPHNEKEISEFEVSDDEDKNEGTGIWVSSDENEDEGNGIWVSSDENEDEDEDPILSRSYPPHVIHHHFHWNMQNTKHKTQKHKKTPKS